MDDKKKKKYVIPEGEIIDFSNQDIITLSSLNANDPDWIGDDNTEDWA